MKLLRQTQIFFLLSTLFLAAPSFAILGGTLAQQSDLVSQSTVALVAFDNPKEPGHFVCTGTLISADLIVTAAHCLDGVAKDSLFASFDVLEIPANKKDAAIVSIEAVKTHPAFAPTYDKDGTHITNINDVGLIKLSKPAPKSFRPAVILGAQYSFLAKPDLLLAGYGVSTEDPEQRTTGLRYARTPFVELDQKNKLVIVDQKNAGACTGDSGGPAYLESKQILFLVGSVRGPQFPDLDCHHLAEFTHLGNFKNFILKTAQALHAQAPYFSELQN